MDDAGTAMLIGLLGLIPLLALFTWRSGRRRLMRRITQTADALTDIVSHHFLAQPCSRCQESEMALLSVSPNARSIKCQCTHCRKTQHAPAASEHAYDAATLHETLLALVERLNQPRGKSAGAERDPLSVEILFETPEAALPFEQSTREPIPEAVRSEVWRRDLGRCVSCSAKQQLEFDHIIPVSRGGATSARNLQLLCQHCNRKKQAKV